MESGTSNDEREIRAARNQALFRAVNERVREVQEAFGELNGPIAIACECADATCIELLEITPSEYEAVRSNPRRFAVRPGHVVPGIEDVITEQPGYMVLEKHGVAGSVADSLAASDGRSNGSP